MGHAHTGRHNDGHESWIDRHRERRVMRLVAAIALPCVGILTAVVAVTWPSDSKAALPFLGNQSGAEYKEAVVTDLRTYECVTTADPNAQPVAGGNTCGTVSATLSGVGDLGTPVEFDADPSLLRQGISVGTRVVLAAVSTEGTTTYIFQDFDRGATVWIAVALLVVVIVAVGRWQGLRALVGLAAGFTLVAGYAVPLLAQGTSALRLIATTVPLLTIVLLYAAHGFTLKTTAAVIGTLAATALAAVGAVAAIAGMNLTGLSSEDDLILLDNLPQISLVDVLTVAIVISGFGALNDVTVTQASAVWELSAAADGRRATRVFASAMRIGRDHIASAIYTVAFAYAGSSLVTLLLILLSDVPTSVTLNSELMADEIAFLVVGLSAVVMSMPITTWVASVLARAVRVRGERD